MATYLSYNQNQSQPKNKNHHPTMDHAEPTTSETTSPQNRNHTVVVAQTDTTSDMPSTQAAAVKETRAMSAPAATAATGLSMAMTNANGNDGDADVGATGSGVEVEEGRSTAAVTATTATAAGVGNAVLTMASSGATAFAPESMVAPAAATAAATATATDVAVNAMDATNTNTNTATSDPALTIQVYTCDVCKVAMFPTLHEAEIHEQGCSAVSDASGDNAAAAAAAAAAGGDSNIATTTTNVAMAPAGNGAGNGASNHPSNPALQRPPSFEIDANLELLHGIVDDHDVGVGHFDDDMPDAHAAHVALTDPHLLASLDGVGGDVVCVDGVGDHGVHGGLGGHQQQQELAATSSAHDVAIAPSMTTVAQSQTTIQPSTSTTTKYPPPTPPTATIPTIPTMPTTTTTLPPTPLMTENNRQRSILTQTYSPYISPTDTSLPHARHRLQTALEQTRIMRAAFTENAYDKYRVRLKSVPNSVDEIIHGIVVDPQERGRVLRERAEIMRVEKEREKREAREESLLQQFSNLNGGVGGGLNGMGAGGGGGGGGGRDGRDGDFDQLSFFGSGLSLVILPEEDADEREVDVNRYPHRGPTDPVTGQRYEGISAAAAAAAELVFDRVRRSHAIRMERDRRIKYEVDSGAGVGGVGGGAVNSYGQSHLLPLNEAAAAAAKPLARSNSKNSQNFRLAESGSNFEADLRKSTGVISPALSNDSNAGNVRQRSSSSKQSIQNLLSLSPEAESTRPDGKLTAVQAALISCGVGANEMRTDGRLKSLQHHQRIPPIDSTAFGMSSSSSLPPLLGARQISRLQPVEVREQEQQQQQQGEGESSSARGAIQTVVDQIICTPTSEFSNIDSKGKSQKQDDSSLDAGFEEGNAVAETNENSGGGGNGSSLVAFSSEHCTSEIAFMRRIRSLELQNLSDYQKASNNVAQSKEEATPIENVQSSVPYIDPVLAFSVMSAVGLTHERVDKGATENADAEFLGLNSLTRLENVSRFFKSNASHERKRRFIDAFAQPVTSDVTTNGDAKSANLDFSSSLNGNSESCPEETVYHIRGGGGDDALNDNEKPSKVTSKTGVSGIQTDKVISANATRPTRDPSQPTSMPLFRSPVDTSNMDSLHSAASQGPFGGNQLPYNSNNQKGQGVATSFGTQIDGKNASLNTAASRQLLQHHLGIHHDPYATAALARQLGLPMGSLPPNNFNQSHLNSISASDLSEYYIRSRLLGAPDWTSLGNTNPSNADILSQHPQLAAAIGLIPGQLNLSMRDQEAARTMLLREQHNMATARAQEAAAAAACYQAALSSISPQNPFGFMGQQISQTSRNSFSGSSPSPSLSHLRSNLPPSNSSLLASTQASAMNELHKKQAGPKKQQRKRSASLTAMKKTPAVEASNATKDTPTDSIMQDAQVKNSQSNSLDPSPLDEANKMQDVPVSQCPSIERLASAPSSSVISTLPSAMLKGDEPISELKLTTKVVADEGVADKIEKSELVPKEHEVAKIPQKNVTTSEKVKPRIMDEKSSSYFQSFPSCLLFNAPKRPKELHDEIADLIAGAKFHKAYLLSKQKSYGTDDLLVEFLTSLGAAVPIPKAMIANLLTESLSTSQYKERMRAFVGYNSSASAARDIIIVSLKIWLWSEYEECFQRAFKKNGRIDTDQECIWLIKVSICKSLSALSYHFQITDSFKNEIPKCQVATVVFESLTKKVVIDKNMSSSLPVLGDLVTLLDSLRMDALQAKTQERVLLAALVSRRGNMSESFSNAYVSSIIRAGEAVGHEEVCEIAQDEECRASTMLPFDFFCDNKGVWEEPCRPLTGYHSNVAGDELKKRAHARAVIQKSVRRMQSRLGLKGGISDGGPYFTVTPSSTPAPSPTAVSTPNPATLVRSSSSSLKRKGSQIIDPSLVSGIGVSGIPETLFNPGHISAPMIWDFDSSSNSPYGRHVVGLRPSIVSVGGHLFNENKRRKTSEILSQGDSLDIGQRSTHEVKWEDVAKMFLNGGSSRSIVTKQIDFGSKQQKEKKEIFAPFIRSVDNSFFDADNDQGNEVSSEEDISDETILRRHQEVLDGMKRKLDAALEKRQQQPQQRVRKK